MENWIGAYRLPPNLGLGVERNNDTVDAGIIDQPVMLFEQI